MLRYAASKFSMTSMIMKHKYYTSWSYMKTGSMQEAFVHLPDSRKDSFVQAFQDGVRFARDTHLAMSHQPLPDVGGRHHALFAMLVPHIGPLLVFVLLNDPELIAHPHCELALLLANKVVLGLGRPAQV